MRRDDRAWVAQLQRCAVVSVLVLGACAREARALEAQPQPSSAGTLVPGELVRRELDAGQSHAWSVTLAPGEFVQIAVEAHDVDLVVTLATPAQSTAAQCEKWNVGIGEALWCVVSAIAPDGGNYTLEVRSAVQSAGPGRYELKVDELRPSRDEDRGRVAAQRLWSAGARLTEQSTNEARRQAVGQYEAALKILSASGDATGQALTLNTLTRIYDDLSDSAAASASATRALELWEATGREREAGLTLGELGLLAHVKYEHAVARGLYARALEKHRAVQDVYAEALTLNRLGWSYNSTGDKRRALELYAQSLELRGRAPSREAESVTLNDIGRAQLDLGDVAQALEVLQRALALRPASQNPEGAANVLNRIGMTYKTAGDWQAAIDAYQHALVLSRQVNDRRNQAALLNNLGAVYNELADNDLALQYLDPALTLCRSLGLRSGEAAALHNLGLVAFQRGDLAQALDYLNQSLAIRSAIGDSAGEAGSLRLLSAVLRASGALRAALDTAQRALSRSRALGQAPAEALALGCVADAHAALGEWQAAADAYEQALAGHRAVRNRPREALTLTQFGCAQAELGNLHAARGLMEEGIALSESLRSRMVDPELRAAYLGGQVDRYQRLVDLLMELDRREPDAGHAARAFEVGEHARARGLVELLAESNVDLRRGVDPTLVTRERTLGWALHAKAAVQTRLLGGTHVPEEAEALARTIDDLARSLRDATSEIRRRSPRYAALSEPELPSSAAVQQLLDDDTVLLAFALGDRRSWLWAVTNTALVGYELPARATLEAGARGVYALLTARQRPPESVGGPAAARLGATDARLQHELLELSEKLLAPIGSKLRGEWSRKRLAIVTSGALEYVPMAALPAPPAQGEPPSANPAPLIVGHEIVNLPSASVLALLRHGERRSQEPGARIAVIADPVFETGDPRVARSRGKQAPAPARAGQAEPPSAALGSTQLDRVFGGRRRSGYARLPFSRLEARAIAELVPRGALLNATDFRASRSLALSGALRPYGLVHFATHGLLDSEHPDLSGLVLSLVDERGRPQDGFLRLQDVYGLELSAETVVLSACQTGLGKEIKGEGLVGLARGFLHAGAQRVVASLWEVDDLATAELMQRFYRGMLQDGLRPAAALRAAQLELLRQPRWSAPYFWSAFVTQGDWQ
jgi:CHAT domain-containing protein/tetratricopeptide (TPR) repeat protein